MSNMCLKRMTTSFVPIKEINIDKYVKKRALGTLLLMPFQEFQLMWRCMGLNSPAEPQ